MSSFLNRSSAVSSALVFEAVLELDEREFAIATKEFIGEKGSLFVYRGGIVTTPKELLKGIEMPKITSSQANFAHVNNFYDCIRSRKSPNADVSIGHRSATVCHLGNIAVRTGRKIQWDPATETIVGDADAAKWVMKEYRKPYKLG